MSLFSGAGAFFLDASTVANSATVDISAIGMYFMYRPSATNNRSGVNNPGITMYLTDVVNGVPNLSNTSIFQAVARAEWNTIGTSSDASVETRFRFNNPVTVTTGKMYAFCFLYDGSEDFLPWTNVKGFDLVSTTDHSPGPSSPYGGAYFLYSGVTNGNTIPTSIAGYQTAWTALTDTDLKFKVYAARYASNGVPYLPNTAGLPLDTPVWSSPLLLDYSSANQSLVISKPAPRLEIVAFDQSTSLKQSFVGPQRAYQETVQYPGGGVWASITTSGSNTVTANTQLSNGATFSWHDVFGSYTGPKSIVIDYGGAVDVRLVTGISSNVTITLDEATTVANTAARFMITPHGVVDSFNKSVFNGNKAALVFLRDSTANSTVRFTDSSLNMTGTTIANGGGSYQNTDILYVIGYESVANVVTTNYPAIANVVTNANGKVVSLAWSNTGAGFTNATNISITMAANGSASRTSNTSPGANLALTIAVGTTIKTEQTNNVFRSCRIVDVDVHTVLTAMDVAHVANTSLTPSLFFPYYLTSAATSTGYAPLLAPTPVKYPVLLNNLSYVNGPNTVPVVVSRSNEFGVHYANGVINDQVSAVLPYSNAYVLQIETKSYSDWVAPGPFNSPLIDFGHYIFNNDYTGEETDQGRALARHITTVVNFAPPANTGRGAEDARLFLSAYRPVGTDIQAYARIQNNADPEAFDDEDWSRLTIVEGSNNYSTVGYTDLTFGFPNQPNSTAVLAGTVSIANGTANLVGTNTAFGTITANTLIKVYDPLFANDDFAVCLVTNVVNSSLISVDRVFSTNASAGIGGFELTGRGGLKVDVLGFGHQAFNDIQTDNVVRYYNAGENLYAGYDRLQVKLVLLSNSALKIPRIHQIRGLGVSA